MFNYAVLMAALLYNNLCVYYFINVIYDKVFEYKLLASIHVKSFLSVYICKFNS